MQDLTLLHWRLASELPFRVLAAWQDDPARPVDVILTVGTVLPHTEEGSGPVHVYVLDDGSALVVAQEIGRFLVSNGGRVIADLVPGVISGAVEMIVIGPVLAALCYQRGLLTLHANTVAINGQAVALCGPSGAGKSTLAAWLATRGQPLVSDDVLPIKRGQSGTIAHTGNRHLRLWRETLVRLGMDADRLERAAVGERDKYFLPPPAEPVPKTWPLRALVWITSASYDDDRIELLTGIARAQCIVNSVYRLQLAKTYNASGNHTLGDLGLPGVDVYVMRRQRDFALIDAHADAIEALIAKAR